LAVFVPARYAKPEEASCIIASLETYVFEIERPAAEAPPPSEGGEKRTEAESAETANIDKHEAGLQTKHEGPAPVPEPESTAAGTTAGHADDQGFPPDTAVHQERFDKEEAVQ
jgi:hypothetical protein